MSLEMHAYVLQKLGGVVQQHCAIPTPGPGQIRVRVQAAGLNRGELIANRKSPKQGKMIGAEAAGWVDAVGLGVSTVQPGDRVMGRCTGAFAEYVLMDAQEALPVPKNLNWVQASSIPLTFSVVYDMLLLQGQLKAGEWLLVTGISSGVGVAALQLAKSLGARVIGTSGSAQKLEKLVGLGLDVPILSRSPDFAEKVMQATAGQGVNLVVNIVGASVFAQSLSCMAFEGRMAIVGHLDGQSQASLDLELLHSNRLRLFGVSNKKRSAEQRAAALPAFIKDVLPAFEDGRIQPLIDQVFPFAELPAAIQHMEANLHVGKIILEGYPE